MSRTAFAAEHPHHLWSGASSPETYLLILKKEAAQTAVKDTKTDGGSEKVVFTGLAQMYYVGGC